MKNLDNKKFAELARHAAAIERKTGNNLMLKRIEASIKAGRFITQREAAETINVYHLTYSNWENGRHAPHAGYNNDKNLLTMLHEVWGVASNRNPARVTTTVKRKARKVA